MAISKETALLNLTKAKLLSQVAWAMYIDYELQNAPYDEYVRTEAKYSAMRAAYMDCGLIDWDDIKKMTTYTIAQEAKEA